MAHEPRDATDPLQRYREKRSADRTPEPFGGAPVAAAGEWSRPRLFCVQKHAARRLHYDFRLEWGGVLLSWAVPQGPATDTAEKRLAVEVEPHPVEYADFEGVIPEGNYGAGHVIVWDLGRWRPLEDPEAGLAKGKLLFELEGYKLRGVWTLVRTKRAQARSGSAPFPSKEWLLIKKPDAWSGADGGRRLTPESVLSGLTLEELAAGESRAAEIRAALEAAGAPRRRVRAADVKLMLAETAEAPFSGPEWLFELKYDGFRMLAAREGAATGTRAAAEARLYYRRGSEASPLYPEIERAVAALPYDGVVLDGEVVVLDDAARPVFQLLQRRAQLQRAADIARAAVERPATFYAFDLVGFEEFDLRPLPLVERKRLLRRLLPRAGPLRFSDHVEAAGEAFYEEVVRLRLEGIVAKRAAAAYRGGRFRDWLKIKADRTGDFVVVGFTRPRGRRTGFGALHLAQLDGAALVYMGRVGSGFSEEQLESVAATLEATRRATPASTGPLPAGGEHVWVEPRLVAEVRYKEWTADHLLRQPVFLRFREDKAAEECWREGSEPTGAASDAEGAAALASQPGGHEGPEPNAREAPATNAPAGPAPELVVPYTNLDKVFWPEQGYTKGDLIAYYEAVSPWLMPYLADRPVVLTRYPDGIRGKSFFQKDAPGFAPGWVRTERMWSEHAQREIDYFVCDRVEMLLYLINLGTIPLHVWSSRVRSLARPDWCILDLDPKGAPLADVVAIALALKRLCDEIGLPAFVKTSGSTGLHVLVPLGRQLSYEEARGLGELLARVVCEREPARATIVRAVSARGGKVYVDYLQNGHGRLLAGPFSARPLPGAPVSAPLAWEEVGPELELGAFNLRTLPERMRRLAADPLRPVLELAPDLAAALGRLAARLHG